MMGRCNGTQRRCSLLGGGGACTVRTSAGLDLPTPLPRLPMNLPSGRSFARSRCRMDHRIGHEAPVQTAVLSQN